MTLGETLRELRTTQQKTQQQIADAIGVAKSTYSLYESDKREPNVFMLKKLAAVFHTTGDYLLSLDYNSGCITPQHRKGDRPENNYFAHKIKGRSMEPRIYDGDIAIVHKQNDVESGEIAVIRVKKDVTTKKILKQEHGVLLIGLNAAAYTPEFYSYEDVEILGKVIEVRGKMEGWDK